MTIHFTYDDIYAAALAGIGSEPVVRDEVLLASAASQPSMSAFGVDAYPTVHMKAAALMRSVIGNHALVDGNKRTALAATLLFLSLNGVGVKYTDDAYDLVLQVAGGKITDVYQIAERINDWPKRG